MKPNAEERRRAKRAGMERKPPPPPPVPPGPPPDPPRPFRRFLLWLGGGLFTLGTVAFGVWLQANYVPRLEVVHVDGVKLPIRQTETTYYGAVRFDLFETRPEFKNHGLRAGALRECKVEPWRNYLSPTVEVTHIDLRPIPRGATEERMVQFRSQSPADPTQRPASLTWSIACWDEAGNSTGKLYTVFYPEGKEEADATPSSAPPTRPQEPASQSQ